VSDVKQVLSQVEEGGRSPYQLFSGIDDETWFWLNTEGYRLHPELSHALPSLPDPDLQARVIGSSGDKALREGFKAYQMFKELYQQHVGSLSNCPAVLDFGCGWGRTIRFFLKDLPSERLLGVDQNTNMIEVCRATNKWCRFEQNQPLPPLDLPTGSIGLAYAYSVFSHLSEETHLRWLAELARVVRPGGLLVATTWHRGFIQANAELRARVGTFEPTTWERLRLATFADTEYWLSQYDQGTYCYQPYDPDQQPWSYVDGKSFYGEACIPQGYALAHWSEYFEVVEFIDDRVRCPQNVIVARKPK